MKKNKAPLGKVNNAIRKAESRALFEKLLLSKASVETPKHKKGTRSVNNRKAISEF